MSLAKRAARLRRQPGLLGRWCVASERVRSDLLRVEQESAALTQRARARVVRWFFEFLVLLVIGIAELVGLWHQAGRALAVRPRSKR
jgi:hypothetical protein